jgi:rhodanese-related sulfurtransferase
MPDNGLRITADELRRRMSAGEEFTILDARNPQAWAEATDKARGAIRVDLHAGDAALPNLPKNKPIVAYCT